MANLQTTTIASTGKLKLPVGTTAQRTNQTVIQWRRIKVEEIIE